MKKRILRVVFETRVYPVGKNKPFNGNFQIGRDTASLLGLKSHDTIDLVIRDARTGKFLCADSRPLESHCEVYGGLLSKYLKPKQSIVVEASS
jgi:hypothetical protein